MSVSVSLDVGDRLALAAGRPVLLVPNEGVHSGIGSRVVVAWNGRREAARAAFDAIPLLQKAGARVLYNDPYVSELRVKDCQPERFESTALSDRLLSTVDCVVMLTCHTCFDCESILRASQVVIDTRNAFRSVNGHPGKVVRI